MSTYQRIYDVVRRIPAGRVATYGQVAALAGLPGHARQVGYALHALEDHSGVPWQRVINAGGRVSPRSVPGFDEVQRAGFPVPILTLNTVAHTIGAAGVGAEEIVGGVGLGVEIDHQGALTLFGTDRRQVADDGGLAYPTLAIEDHT